MFLSLDISRFLFTSRQLPFIVFMNSLMVKFLRLKERICERHLHVQLKETRDRISPHLLHDGELSSTECL